MAYYDYNSDNKVENLTDFQEDIELYNLTISEKKGENIKETEINYPEDLLEILNKQCYFLQSLSLESTFNNTISLAYLNEERIILDIKLSNLLKTCDEIKSKGDLHKELISDWLSVNLQTYDNIVKQLHGFFNRNKNVSGSNDNESSELMRLKEREKMILNIQRDRENLD